MDSTVVVTLCRDTMALAVVLSLPLLAVALVVGIVVSIVQAATQVQDQALSFVPKTLAVYATIALLGGWILHLLCTFATRVLGLLPGAGL